MGRMVVGPSQSVLVPRSRILVVDDEVSICAMVQKTLRSEALTIATTSRASEALELLERDLFDLLITDINMPEMNGLQLAERARSLQPTIGIMIMTAYGSFENMARAIRTGISDFIIKPFNIDDMRNTVQRALDRLQLQRDNMRLHTLVNVFEYSRAINSTLESETLYSIVSDLVRRETGATSVVVAQPADGADLEIVYSSDAMDQARLHEFAAQVWASGSSQPVVSPASADTMLVAVALGVREERLGVLIATYRMQAPPVELLAVIAYQAALAMRNARQFEALRDLDRLKSEFIGIASHELRTPLSLVLGYSSLLRSRLQGREREALQHVIDGALRMGDIIDDLVHLRRADQHALELDVSQFDLGAVLHEIVREMQPLADSRGVKMLAQVPTAPMPIVADHAHIEAALAQLVDNATKFTEAGGQVEIMAQPPTPGEPYVVRVWDTGIGIARHDLGRIFDRFYQTAPSATRVHNGLGVGLTLAKLWIELHGGSINVQSTSGQGSVFEVRLPAQPG